jgi:hypothetical protein
MSSSSKKKEARQASPLDHHLWRLSEAALRITVALLRAL